MPPNKEARSRSNDPVQEHLRQRKQEWNAECSEFIAHINAFKPHLISFKRGLNGRGDAKAGLPPSDIKEELPPQIPGYLNNVRTELLNLVQNFSALVDEANGIVSEQSMYAAKRRKGQPKARPMRPMAGDTNDLMIAQGSNSISRFWANIKHTFSRDPLIEQRLSTLAIAQDIFALFVDFEDEVLSKGVDNIPQVLNCYFSISNKIIGLSLSIKRLRELQGDKPASDKNPPTNNDQDTSGVESANNTIKIDFGDYSTLDINSITLDNMKHDFMSMIELGVNFTMADAQRFFEIYNQRAQELNKKKREIMEDRLRQIYLETLDIFKSKVQNTFDVELPPEIDVKSICNAINKKADLEDSSLEKLGSSSITRLLKKYRHYLGSKTPSTAPRIDIYRKIREAKKNIDRIMDELEKSNFDLTIIDTQVSDISKIIHSMRDSIKILNVIYKDRFFRGDRNIKPINNPATRYFTKQIRNDIDNPGW